MWCAGEEVIDNGVLDCVRRIRGGAEEAKIASLSGGIAREIDKGFWGFVEDGVEE